MPNLFRPGRWMKKRRAIRWQVDCLALREVMARAPLDHALDDLAATVKHPHQGMLGEPALCMLK